MSVEPVNEQRENKVMSTQVASIKPPKALIIEDNMAAKWKQWWRQFNWYSVATELSEKTPQIQAATLLSCIGDDCIRLLDTFGLTDEEENDITVLKEKFQTYFVPKSCVTYERYVFGKIVQGTGEQFDTFVTRVREQAKKCAFETLHDSLLKDRIIAGTVHTKLIPQLLNDDNDLQKTVDIIRGYEQSVKQSKVMLEKPVLEVDVVRQRKSEMSREMKNDELFSCNRCGTDHRRRACPAFNKTCLKCGRRGHYAEKCFGSTGTTKRNSRFVKTVECEDEDGREDELLVEELFIASIDDDGNNDDVWYETVKMKNIEVKLKLDSGAACNVLPLRIFRLLGEELKASKTKRLVSFSNHKLTVRGEAQLPVVFRGREESAIFKIVDGDVMPILGRKTSVRFQLITRVDEVKMEESLFSGLGCVKGFIYDIDLVDDPNFRCDPPRRIPHSLRDAVKAELDSMQRMGVIEPITEPTPVLNAMVIVRQKGKLRICIDPSQVNKNLLRRVHPLSTIEEISARICHSKCFTILDMKKGFWQIPVSARTTKYLAFGTPWGRYTCKRLPFGLASAPEVFQKLMNTILEGIDGVESSMDDILIHAPDEEQLCAITNVVLTRIKEAGLKLNKEKCQFNKKSVKFLGHLVTQDGLKADPEKLDAVRRLKRPTTKLQLQRVLGTITYLGKFIKNLSALTEPLRKLLVKDTEWTWEVEQEQAFQRIKQTMLSPPVLAYYDVNAKVTLSVDASSKAFGAVLLQNGKPVAYASKSLTKAQEGYPQIEKEAAAIRYACNKFHDYIYGKELEIETDHKPLESIAKKSLDRAPPRLKRILLDVTQYSPVIKYKKGTDIPLPDILSRDVDNVDEQEKSDELEVHIVLQMTKSAKEELIEESDKDQELKLLTKVIMEGWPDDRRVLPCSIRKYWTFRDELSVYEGLIFRSNQIVVPRSLTSKMLRVIHTGHTGVQGCIRRAKQMLFWLGMTTDIARMVETCAICEKFQRSNQKHELLTNEIPTLPFEIVGSDLFSYQGDDYLLIADSYSGYYDFVKLAETNSKAVIEQMKRWFATHGIPRILYTDNGPQYASSEFTGFAKKWSFEHVTSSPHFPRSNGLSERFVQTAKNVLKRCTEDGSDVQLALLLARNTPRDTELQSANHRLFSRVLRTNVPTVSTVLKPNIVKNVTEFLKQRRLEQKKHADVGSAKPPEFEEGQVVAVQDPKSKLWKQGEIDRKLVQPRSYMVKLADGRIMRRNIRDIRRSMVELKKEEEPWTWTTEADIPEDSEAEQEIDQQPEETDEHSRNQQHRGEHRDEQRGEHRGVQRGEQRGELHGEQRGEHCNRDRGEYSGATSTLNEPMRTRSGRVVRGRRDVDFEYY